MSRINRENLFSVCTGDAPYVHVICAKEDFKRIYSIIRQLDNSGFRIWYDEDMATGGNGNSDSAFESLKNSNCRAVLFFFSPNCELSLLIQNEINLAASNNKFLCCALLDDDAELPTLLDCYGNKQVLYNLEAIAQSLPDECRTDSDTEIKGPSDFLTENDAEGVRIKRFFGNDSTIDLPSEIGDRPVISIDSFAFSAKSPITISIPMCVRSIALSAFSFNNNNVTIICAENSPAHSFALSENIRFTLSQFDTTQDAKAEILLAQKEKALDLPQTLELTNDYSDPYIYISLAKKDTEAARSIIERLSGLGYRLYVADRNSDTENVRKKIIDAAVYLIFISENTYNDEFVVETELPCLSDFNGLYYSVCIDEKLTIPESFRSQRVLKKSINRADYTNFERFFVALCEPLAQCRGEEELYNPDFKFITTKSGVIITKYNGYSTRPEIEDTYLNQPLIEIGEFAFSGCDFIEQIVIPDGVKIISGFAFSGCKGLKTVVLPSSVKKLGSFVFSGCSSLEDVVLPDEITEMGSNVFDGCMNLATISMPSQLKSIGWYTFNNCTALRTVRVPNGLTEIGDFAFSGCTMLESVEIPRSVTNIGKHAFKGCEKLKLDCNNKSYAHKFASRAGLIYNTTKEKGVRTGQPIWAIILLILLIAALGCIGLQILGIIDLTKFL